MTRKAFLKHPGDHRDDGAFERYPSQLTRALCGFSQIVAHPERNPAQGSIAIGEGDAAACDQAAEANVCHRL